MSEEKEKEIKTKECCKEINIKEFLTVTTLTILIIMTIGLSFKIYNINNEIETLENKQTYTLMYFDSFLATMNEKDIDYNNNFEILNNKIIKTHNDVQSQRMIEINEDSFNLLRELDTCYLNNSIIDYVNSKKVIIKTINPLNWKTRGYITIEDNKMKCYTYQAMEMNCSNYCEKRSIII